MKLSHALPAALVLSLAVPLGLAPAQAGTGGFQAGDLYVYSPALTAISAGGGLTRVQPGTGSASPMFSMPVVPSSHGDICYDPWRDRLVFYGGFAPNTSELWTSDAAGNLQGLGFAGPAGPTIHAMAPRGDGKIYCVSFTNSLRISYLDETNQMQTLKDASGADYVAVAGSLVYVMHYDPASNSLILASHSNLSDCPSEVFDSINLFVLSLSADGTRVLSESCLNYETLAGAQPEIPESIGQGPDGDLILVVSTNGSAAAPRMARIDLGALTAVPYASTAYTAAGVIRGGTYSHVLDKAVVLDPYHDVLRAYAEGESGGGTIIATSDVSYPGISSEVSTVIEVAPAPSLSGMSADTTAVALSAGGTQTLSLGFGAAHAGELYLVLGSASGWAPGLPSGGVLLPLNFDAYLSYTLFHPNAPPLAASLGALDGAGAATCTFSLPAGTDPALAGAVLHHAATALDASLAATRVSNPVPVALVP